MQRWETMRSTRTYMLFGERRKIHNIHKQTAAKPEDSYFHLSPSISLLAGCGVG